MRVEGGGREISVLSPVLLDVAGRNEVLVYRSQFKVPKPSNVGGNSLQAAVGWNSHSLRVRVRSFSRLEFHVF